MTTKASENYILFEKHSQDFLMKRAVAQNILKIFIIGKLGITAVNIFWK